MKTTNHMKNKSNSRVSKTHKAKHSKTVVFSIQPLMPSSYTALERKQLREFERRVMLSKCNHESKKPIEE